MTVIETQTRHRSSMGRLLSTHHKGPYDTQHKTLGFLRHKCTKTPCKRSDMSSNITHQKSKSQKNMIFTLPQKGMDSHFPVHLTCQIFMGKFLLIVESF